MGRVAPAVLVVAAFVAVVPAAEMQPVTTVGHFHVAFGKEAEFVDMVRRIDTPVFEKLMKEGAVLAWGLSTPVMHAPGLPTHSIWWSSPSMAEMDVVHAEFEALEKRLTEDEPEFFSKMAEIVDLSLHRDEIFRDVVFGHASEPPPAGARPYTWIYTVKANPGKEGDFMALWNEVSKPVFEKLIADGTITSYGLSVPELRTGSAFTHFTWFGTPDFASYEKARATYMEFRMGRPEEEQKKIAERIAEAIDMDASRTLLMREEIFHVAPPSE